MNESREHLIQCASHERDLAAFSKDMAGFRMHMQRAREFDHRARRTDTEVDYDQATSATSRLSADGKNGSARTSAKLSAAMRPFLTWTATRPHTVCCVPFRFEPRALASEVLAAEACYPDPQYPDVEDLPASNLSSYDWIADLASSFPTSAPVLTDARDGHWPG
jgi:hypothetical protein